MCAGQCREVAQEPTTAKGNEQQYEEPVEGKWQLVGCSLEGGMSEGLVGLLGHLTDQGAEGQCR